MKNKQTYLILIGIMLLWGFNVSFLKIIVTSFMPVTMTSFRIFTAGITVLTILAIIKQLRKPTLQEIKFIVFGGLLNVVGHHYFLSTGLAKTTAANGGLILGLGPVLTAIFSIIFLNKKLTPLKLAGFLLGFAGVTFTVLAGGKGITSINIGDLDIFICIISQAASFMIVSKAAKIMDPRLLTGYMLIFGSFILFGLGLWTEPGGLASMATGSLTVWACFFASAVFATAVGHMTYNSVIGKAGAAEASIFMNLNTFFALLGSALLLGEKILPAHFIGLLLIIGGVLLGSGAIEELRTRSRNRRQRQEEQAKLHG
ncbi:DMT family transporter [Metabacillus sp. GX 13764]|uniref:DMT family transporter n=1 Tax=Metabacillus kandeliae TaxID=2900151 RepID=UPI001E613E41|nr:DMT family transporter [Metabacillus kandeliae]MCD7036530.1 DMT family transporter [Metabacillus kandeliae]